MNHELDLHRRLLRTLRVHSGGLSINENGCWITYAVMKIPDDKCLVRACFPLSGTEVTPDWRGSLLIVQAKVPRDLNIGG